jgi:hypothetical protein
MKETNQNAQTTNRGQPIPTQIRINQLYFSTFLLQERHAILMTKQELESKIKEVKSGIKFGAILPRSEVLEAEKLNKTTTHRN